MMDQSSATLFAYLWVSALCLATALRLWLALRHAAHVRKHRDRVPPAFAATISAEAHRRAADYTAARVRLSIADLLTGALLALLFTLGGGLQALYDLAARFFAPAGYLHGLAFFGLVALAGAILDLPFGIYRTFVLEQRFGFNRMTPRLFAADLAKSLLLTLAIGTPLLFAVLWLMQAMGQSWWLYVWLLWIGFSLLSQVIYPLWIAPLFNKFSPLDNPALRARIEALLARCGFRVSGLFVIDGSRRSAHGNAYFTGFGAAKRIVFFDTLLDKLQAEEIEAVLAHELGHFRHHHIVKGMLLMAALSLGLLWLLGQLIHQPWFFQGLGMQAEGTAAALVLFSLVLPAFLFPLTPLFSALSRRNEYEADAFAAANASAGSLVDALVKLYRDNASTLTPDPLYSAFYDSHPPAALRIARLAPRGAH
ncbi:MAG: M48 family metallopeptidase [Rhodocyclaceae bacterium]|nr:M48 family metallopeptidase [Rhodocyclaceae bacterium]MBX3669381.1 M48 family metallopeptidase [Rhodocyclaceae bacterium]